MDGEGTPPDGRLVGEPGRPGPGWWGTLRGRTTLGAIALVALTAALTATLAARVLEARVVDSMRLHAKLTSERIATRLSSALAADDRAEMERVLDDEMGDARLAFLAIDDAQGATTVSVVRDLRAWELQGAGRPWLTSAPGVGLPIRDGEVTLGVASVKPVWGARAASGPDGWLRVGVVFQSFAAVRSDLWTASIASACVAALAAMPLVIVCVRRLSAPIGRVATAARDLAELRRPDPLPEAGVAELASLSRTFNFMARRLVATREALERSHADLERTVDQRTDELRRVNELLQLEVKEKNEFLRTLSHDLGAPLRSIAGMTSMLMQKHSAEMSEEAMHRLERIAANVRLESEMLGDLMELSSLSTTGERAEEVDPARVARAIAQAFEHELRSRGVDLVIEEPLPVVRVEPGRLRTVLQNLIENALKYMGDAKERRITVRARMDDLGAEFCVEDTGPGIPECEHLRIFEAFRRGSTAQPGIEGRGVGLAAVRSVVERWSGRLRLESSPGRGSRFCFTVPRDRLGGARAARPGTTARAG